jgi:hypothetical protein
LGYIEQSLGQKDLFNARFHRLIVKRADVHGTKVGNLLLPTISDPLSFVQAIDDAKGISNNAAVSAA